MQSTKPHPNNVPGDFYVEDGCCITCGVPYVEAPELFGGLDPDDSTPHCYVKRQPQSSLELEHMMNAIRCSEVGCIRYRGSDRLVQLELVATEDGYRCDRPLPEFQTAIEAQAAEQQRWWAGWQADHGMKSEHKPWWKFWA